MKRLLTTAIVSLAAALLPATALADNGNGAGGVTGTAFYANGRTYRTVATPTDLSSTGAPTDSFDIIYDFDGAQLNVAEAAPGDTDYNGGRWRVQLLSFSTNYTTTMAAHDLDGSGVIDSDAEVLSALGDAGPAGATIAGSGPSSVCPVILIP